MRQVTYHNNGVQLDWGRAWTCGVSGAKYAAHWWYVVEDEELADCHVTTQPITDPEELLRYNGITAETFGLLPQHTQDIINTYLSSSGLTFDEALEHIQNFDFLQEAQSPPD